MEAIGITSGSLSGIAAAFRVAEIGFQLRDVREDAQTFVRLVKLVEDDLEHALACRIDVTEALRGYPDHYRKWIIDSIRRAMDVLDDFGRFVLGGTEDQKLSLDKRISYLLKNYHKLVDREKALGFAHTSLLATINFMHLIFVQGGASSGSSERLRVPGSPPTTYPTEVKRASSQRPRPRSPVSFPPTPDPTPPGSQGSMAWGAPPSVAGRNPEIESARESRLIANHDNSDEFLLTITALQSFQQIRQRQKGPSQFP